MNKTTLKISAVLMGLLFLPACFSPKTAIVDGKTVLTNQQYEAMLVKLKQEMQPLDEQIAEIGAGGANNFDSGVLFYQKHDFANAATEFSSVVKNNNKNSKAWYLLGSCYEQIGDLTLAQEAFKRSYDLMVEQGYVAEIGAL